jgi:hypothetical protein
MCVSSLLVCNATAASAARVFCAILAALRSYEVGYIHRHLINLRAIELFYISQYSDIIASHEVDCYSLPPESSTSSNTMDIQLSTVREIITDHQ